MKKYCFGVDLGGTTVKLGLFDMEEGLIERWEIPTRTENGGEAIIPDIASAVNGKMKERQLHVQDMAGIGIDVPAPVNADGSVPHTANIGWGYKAVTKELGEMTGLPCFAGNDADVAALGEMWKGSAAGHKDVLMVTLGTGVGGGIIAEGKILNGAHGAAGEIGHFPVPEDVDWDCGCGNRGCLEQFASATGIVRMAKDLLGQKADTSSLMREGELTCKLVFDCVKEGDTLAVEVAERFGKILGQAIAGITVVLDPEVIVVGGGVSKAGQIVLDYIKKYYEPRAFKSTKETPFVIAALGNDAGIYGCAKLVADNR